MTQSTKRTRRMKPTPIVVRRIGDFPQLPAPKPAVTLADLRADNADLAAALGELLTATAGEIVGAVHLARQFPAQLANVTRQAAAMPSVGGEV